MSEPGKFVFGQRVKWCFRSTWFSGTIVAVVPPGEIPNTKGKPRSHESYVVAARKLNSRSQPTGREETRWPLVSKLRIA